LISIKVAGPILALHVRMDIRLEVIRINGTWTVTTDGPELLRFANYEAAIARAIDLARRHHAAGKGDAAVHAWQGAQETVVFDTGSAAPPV
jgi:hypothetical protein